MANGGIVRRPAVPPPVRIRRDINSLAVTDDIIVFYAKAIAVMKMKGIDDPNSWRYQSAIHDYPFPDSTLADRSVDPGDPNTFDRDPLADPKTRPADYAGGNDTLPADRTTFWRQCQHFTWFFLPWHRMYLHHFEKIVAGVVASLPGGPKDWALPYWRWNGPEGMGRLPVALRSLAKGGLQHLFIPDREPKANNGDRFANDTQTDTAFDFLTPNVFDGLDTFGGPKVRRHAGDTPIPEPPVPPALDGSGKLENTPHGSMHVAVGRPPLAWMRSFKKAPLDPIFWLHHCNIDRLWEVWIQRDPVNQNPDDKLWLDASFKFHAADGKNGDMTCRQVLNTRKAPLLYEYDDTSDSKPKAP